MKHSLFSIMLVLVCVSCARPTTTVVLSKRYAICSDAAMQVDQIGSGVEDTDIARVAVDGIPIAIRTSSFPDQRILNLATRNRFAGFNLSPDMVLIFDLYDQNSMRRVIGVKSPHGRHGRLYVDLEVNFQQEHSADAIATLSRTLYKCK